MCMWKLPTPTDNSQTLVGHMRIQLNSDATYLKTESDSTGKVLNPTRSFFTSLSF